MVPSIAPTPSVSTASTGCPVGTTATLCLPCPACDTIDGVPLGCTEVFDNRYGAYVAACVCPEGYSALVDRTDPTARCLPTHTAAWLKGPAVGALMCEVEARVQDEASVPPTWVGVFVLVANVAVVLLATVCI
jgi:hypothetical protein